MKVNALKKSFYECIAYIFKNARFYIEKKKESTYGLYLRCMKMVLWHQIYTLGYTKYFLIFINSEITLTNDKTVILYLNSWEIFSNSTVLRLLKPKCTIRKLFMRKYDKNLVTFSYVCERH